MHDSDPVIQKVSIIKNERIGKMYRNLINYHRTNKLTPSTFDQQKK